MTKSLEKFGIACTLDLVEGCMTVKTTRKTYDPVAILNARDLIRLLSRSVPAPQAVKIMQDEVACDVIKIRTWWATRSASSSGGSASWGPNGSTLKALELLTDCYMLVQGNTVAAMGSYRGLKTVRRVVEDTMANIHPIYAIKELMIKRELAKDPELAAENWDRFLPHFKKRNVKKRRAAPDAPDAPDKSKKPYTPFPPPQEMSKVDKQIESGEYFLSRQARERNAREDREARMKEKKEAKQQQRAHDFVPPAEKTEARGKKRKRQKE